jgi:ketosteroid isomerase-like protein
MIAGLALALALQTATAPPEVVKVLEQIEQRLGSTYQKGDCAGWGAMLAPEWSVVHVNGQIITRAQAVETCNGPRPPIDAFTIDEISVRAFGNTAVVTGRTRVTLGGSTPQSVTLRFTDVFFRRDRKWLVVASQATQVQ